MKLVAGATVSTKHFGGLEAVKIKSVETDYYIVSRFSGQATDVLPMDQVEEVLRQGSPVTSPSAQRPEGS